MGDPTEGLTKAMSDAFSVVEMSVEDSATRSPFLSALTGHAKTASVNHVGNDLAHKVVHDTRFVEVHLGKPALKHAESVAATAGDASAGHEEAFADHFHMDPCFAGRDVAECIGGSSCRRLAGVRPRGDRRRQRDLAPARVAGERKDEPDLLWHPPHLRSERAAAPSNPLHAMGPGVRRDGRLATPPGGGATARRRDDALECLTQTLLGASDRDAAAALTKTLFRAVGATLRDNPSPALNVARPARSSATSTATRVRCLAALKVRYPRRIHLNRGNHESAEMNAGMSARGESGFDADVRAKLGEWAGDEVFKVIQAEFFHWLPVATVIESAVLVVHGGIGDGKWTLGDLSEIPYPVEEP
ncbi:phosphoprotein phosphatase [Aureococcus anophagefferens]|nr:phosphoprotein phosphatase [Aureococcus anophagefferens]